MAGFEQLWSGWRGEYVAGVPGDADLDTTAPACVFCRIVDSGLADQDSYIVARGAEVFAILNVYPYATGHLMVMPYRHVADLDDLTGDERSELMAMVTEAVTTLRTVYGPEGFNMGMNLGRVAGAGIPGHLHAHVLPRWGGDTNFMTTVANTRVLPEALEVTWQKLADAWPPADERQ